MSTNKRTESDRNPGGRGRRYRQGTRVTRISVRGVRRSQPDYRRYAQVVIELAQAKAEAEAQAHHETRIIDVPTTKHPSKDSTESKGVA